MKKQILKSLSCLLSVNMLALTGSMSVLPSAFAEDSNNQTELNGHKYQRFDDGMKWEEAKAYCESLGGHLVTITSKEEEKLIESMIDNGTKITYHIGLTDDGNNNYSWITGEPLVYNNDLPTVDVQTYCKSKRRRRSYI